jgi:predicted transcriptional regulator
MQQSCNCDSSRLGGEIQFMAEHKSDSLFLPSHVLQRKALEALWEHGRSSIRDVVDWLDSKLHSEVPYNTVASALNTLCNSGFATRVRLSGAREYLYSALVSREQLEKASTQQAVQTVFEKSRNRREALSYLVEIVGESDSRRLDDLGKVVEHKRRVTKDKRER